MKKYEDGKYIELSPEEIEELEKEEDEYIQNLEEEETDDTANAIKEKATGKIIMLKDASPNTEGLTVKALCTHTASGILYQTGQNVWNEKCTFDIDSLCLMSDFVHVVPETDYYFYSNSPVSIAEMMDIPLFCRIRYYDISEQEISVPGDYVSSAKRNSKVTTPPDCYYIRFYLYENYGSTYKNDICINVYDERINGSYVPYQGEEAYFYNTSKAPVKITPEHSVITLFVEEDDVVLECEYNKDTKGAISDAVSDAKDKWELISSGTLTEEVSLLAITGFSCSKVALSMTVKGSAKNASESALSVRTNLNSGDFGGTDSSLTQIFKRSSSGAVDVNAMLEMKNRWITGQLFSSSGVSANYINQNKYDKITAMYLQPKTSGIVFGVGTTYELWGVKE